MSRRDGALWPRWAMHHIQGYGYPTFIIQSPLGFYVAEAFMLLGAGWDGSSPHHSLSISLRLALYEPASF